MYYFIYNYTTLKYKIMRCNKSITPVINEYHTKVNSCNHVSESLKIYRMCKTTYIILKEAKIMPRYINL